MKKITLLFLIFSLQLLLYGEDFFETRTDHYLIKSTLSSELSAQTGYILEQLYGLFTDLTGDPQKPLPLLRVIELGGEEEFHNYLENTWKIKSQNYLLIREGESGYSEIIIHRLDGELNLKELAHLAVFQYLEGCNSETPFWFKEGLARYFEMVTLQEEGNPEILFNWGAYGEYINRIEKISLTRLLSLNEEEMEREYLQTYPECWGFLHYLMNGKGKEARLFWDYLSKVRSGLPGEWPSIDSALWEIDYLLFMESINPNPGIAEELKALFLKDYYTKALELISRSGEEESWLGLYYTGLIHYERGLFEDSLDEFTLALERGGSEAIMKYAMGLSLLELEKREEGLQLLKEVNQMDKSLIPGTLSPLLE